MEKALREGRFRDAPTWPLRTLSAAGIGLGMLTALLILLD
jgi:hypothetical protein